MADCTLTAILADVIAEPGDDGLRLIYADRLEENGEFAHASYVRDAVAGRDPRLDPWDFWRWFGLLAVDAFPGSPAAWPCDGYANWRVGYMQAEAAARRPSWRLHLARGFVEGVEAPVDAWGTFSAAWLTRTPLRAFAPLPWGSYRRELTYPLRAFLNAESVGRLDTLDLSAVLASAQVFGLFQTLVREVYRPWRGLRRLVLPAWVSPATVGALRRLWPHVPVIERVEGPTEVLS